MDTVVVEGPQSVSSRKEGQPRKYDDQRRRPDRRFQASWQSKTLTKVCLKGKSGAFTYLTNLPRST